MLANVDIIAEGIMALVTGVFVGTLIRKRREFAQMPRICIECGDRATHARVKDEKVELVCDLCERLS